MKTRFVWALAAAAVIPCLGWGSNKLGDIVPKMDDSRSVLTPLSGTAGASVLSVSSAPAPIPAADASPEPSPRAKIPPVVPYEKLLPFLPEPPAGWTAEKPTGSLTEIEVFNLSTVSRIYEMGDNEKSPVATVTIIDAGGHKGYFETITGQWKTTEETPLGYDRWVMVDGEPAFEHYNQLTRSSSLCMIVAKRFFVQIDLTNRDPKELQDWLKKIDLKKLAELK